MKVVNPRCAGIDIHKKTMTVCRFVDRGNGSAPELERRKLPTHSDGVRQLAGWLREHQITEVAMESTGVYWKPVWNALEGEFGLHLCNPYHVRAIPGSKTDLRDGTRIAELLAYGKLPESFIPPRWQRELRDLTRLRKRFVQQASRSSSRIQKVLEDAQIKLASVASDVMGVSGRQMIEAMAAGETDPERLADLARGRMKKSKAALSQALDGELRDHHRFQLRLLLEDWQHCQRQIQALEERIATYLEPYAEQIERLEEMPGVDQKSVGMIMAEIGPDMSHWEDSQKLANWACLCPGNNESAGKRLSGKTRKGNPWLRGGFCQISWAASRTKGSYFKAQHRRLAGRRGKQRAVLAGAHTAITIIYHLLSTPGLRYRDLGEDYFDKRNAEQTAKHLVRRLVKLGFEVDIKEKAA